MECKLKRQKQLILPGVTDVEDWLSNCLLCLDIMKVKKWFTRDHHDWLSGERVYWFSHEKRNQHLAVERREKIAWNDINGSKPIEKCEGTKDPEWLLEQRLIWSIWSLWFSFFSSLNLEKRSLPPDSIILLFFPHWIKTDLRALLPYVCYWIQRRGGRSGWWFLVTAE